MENKYEIIYRKLNVTPTKQRVDLAKLIFSKKQHFTATDLISVADKKNLNISMATIYNTLSLLETKGMLKTINIENDLKFYDTNLDNHHHLYNTTMSTLTDIDHDQVVFSDLPELPKNLQIESTEVLIKVKNR
ncbi:MAG: transcriptional repressor [Gammaproteobacteria bacterium]